MSSQRRFSSLFFLCPIVNGKADLLYGLIQWSAHEGVGWGGIVHLYGPTDQASTIYTRLPYQMFTVDGDERY